jgi:dTDP-4-dehydrorhamnose reductase
VKVAVLGGDGVLARELGPALESAGFQASLLGKAACDVTDLEAVRRALANGPWAAVVNCAAYTQVDRAEDEPERAFAVNAGGAGHAARAAAELGVPFLHVSTDYAFDGRKRTPYDEEDPPSPLGVYARSKVAGEEAVREAGGRWTIVRAGELYGHGGRNFFHAILARARSGQPLKVVSDQVVTPTWSRDLARQLVTILQRAPAGLYHCTAQGETSWHQAAVAALELAGLKATVEPVTTAEYGSRTPRPLYSVLGHRKLEALGLYRMRPWREALGEWIGQLTA